MGDVAYLQRKVRSDAIGTSTRDEFSVPGMPGLSRVIVDHGDGISMETVSLDGIAYMSLAEAASAWRLKRQRDILADVVGNALHQLMLGDEAGDWDAMPASKKEGWIAGANTFLQALEKLGMHVTKQQRD